MTDAEVICTFMEPEPDTLLALRWHDWSIWYDDSGQHHYAYGPCKITLDALWEVEERLTDEQWWEYERQLCPRLWRLLEAIKGHIHATAEQKIKALAAVLRPIVEPK